ncbi:phosphate-starvation-inducible PsiE family protein [Synechococcus sp. BA-132 BA5]|nr:phosphate-starvation-inducible PsiE family protein [Synechococcus sp. BA-132 BA5]MEA5416514.1 phosphate-starvation-inducible PsiE family protein [Synechococcus sp. BA-132 BA5]
MWLLGHDWIDPHNQWFGEELIRLLDQVLVILIALEVMQNLTGYPRDHVILIELALVTTRPPFRQGDETRGRLRWQRGRRITTISRAMGEPRRL